MAARAPIKQPRLERRGTKAKKAPATDRVPIASRKRRMRTLHRILHGQAPMGNHPSNKLLPRKKASNRAIPPKATAPNQPARTVRILPTAQAAGTRKPPMRLKLAGRPTPTGSVRPAEPLAEGVAIQPRRATRLNSSHRCISYAVFCLKKKKKKTITKSG